MAKPTGNRVFKTARFSKDARKAGIADQVLEALIREVMVGQADDLGGGVYKKRLNDNKHRAILLARGGPGWVYEFLFAKKDRSNIRQDELMAFRRLAKAYAELTDQQLAELLRHGDLLEIIDDNAQAQVQD